MRLTQAYLLPALLLASTLLTGLVILFLSERRHRERTVLNLAGTVATLALIVVMLWGVAGGREYVFVHTVLPGLDLMLRADALALLFGTLSA
ncbi:hypothetical protein B7L10_039345, partial [Burkholderia cenocepacia]|uniref:hypothetical protein n=1 Tax=Burkholderia cenocepacia TaxID=95486 RepID=UPI002237D391